MALLRRGESLLTLCRKNEKSGAGKRKYSDDRNQRYSGLGREKGIQHFFINP